MRLFVAIHFSAQVNQALLRAQAALRQQGSGNFSRPENLHLTLAFIGETDRLADAIRAIKVVSQPSFSIKLQKIGHFGDLYWVGAVENPALSALQKQVSKALTDQGFSLEKRTFLPHLTLCRRYRHNGTGNLADVSAALGTPECRITRVSLMESKRIQGRLVYVERFGKDLLR